MKPIYPRYHLNAFSGEENESLFYMTRLQRLVKEFKGINKAHTHSFYLIMWIDRGYGTHTIDFNSYEVKGRQLYFLTPGQVHSWEFSPDIEGYNLYFEYNFFQSRFPGRLLQYPFFHSHQHKPILDTELDRGHFSALFDDAYEENKGKKINRGEVFLSYLHLILESANRLYHQNLPIGDTLFYDRMMRYERLVEQHFIEIRDIKTYAAMLNVTPNHLNHICKVVLGKTASQLHYDRLIIEAKRLLLHTELTIKEVGFKLKFEDPSYFVRFFKKHTGLTPQAFRSKMTLV
ncbi:AraC-like DNA-binding protein [Dyadobacter jejuensis]|uniref:AraC-like DNA-binding protein n=1 Tax=Dyadobacter jejuensis TaxID=1082580 RepID=A0A316AGK9_9BACT|nr:helix-turn-helix domain-containing protein [Dyadobacter jejuensis]PWJ56732.1 AraC-like DNA-binding protein [Dyadobacter jejuensis]